MKNLSEVFGQNKIFKHFDKLKNYDEGNIDTIVTAKIDMTNECDSYCPGCSGGRTNKSSLTQKQAFYIINQLKDMKVKGLVFSGGGEPALNPATSKAIQYAKSTGLDVGLITNGTSLDNKIIKSIIENGSWVRVSLDAGSPQMYKKNHGLDTKYFNKVLGNIKKLVDTKNKINSQCTVGVGFLTRGYAISDMINATKIVKKLGVDYIQFRTFHGDFSPIDKELEECKKLETDNFKVLSSEHKYSRFDDKNKRPYKKCLAMNFITIIDADMNVKTCCHMKGKPFFTLGNLKENTLREIWTNKKKNVNWENITAECPYFCQGDTLNRVLDNITKYNAHQNFL